MKIFSDNIIEYNWFKNLNNHFLDVDFEIIKKRGKNIELVEELIKYDRPDIILLDNEKVLLVIEKTREVPTGHNVGQRMARLIRAVELGIPTIYFCPFKARKHGQYSSICNINGRLFECFHKIWSIHNTPIHLVNWNCDNHGELIDDGTEDDAISQIIEMYVKTNFRGNTNFLEQEKENLLIKFEKSCKEFNEYKNPPKSVEIISTKLLLKKNEFFLSEKIKKELSIFSQTVIYKIEMKESKTAKRQDPYTGTQFIYDYLYCREGKKVEDKKKNLILFFPLIKKNFWMSINPNNNSKSSNWYLTANGLLFADGFISLR